MSDVVFKFDDCSSCTGMCCITPPGIANREELDFALEREVNVVALEVESGMFVVAVKKVNGACPFLSNGKCSVHENRFQRCVEFKCNLINGVGALPEEIISSNFYDKDIARKLNLIPEYEIDFSRVERVDIDGYTQSTVAVDMDDYFNVIKEFFIKQGV